MCSSLQVFKAFGGLEKHFWLLQKIIRICINIFKVGVVSDLNFWVWKDGLAWQTYQIIVLYQKIDQILVIRKEARRRTNHQCHYSWFFGIWTFMSSYPSVWICSSNLVVSKVDKSLSSDSVLLSLRFLGKSFSWFSPELCTSISD